MSLSTQEIIAQTQKLYPQIEIRTGHALAPLLKGFRGKQGQALAAVYPETTTALYQLISLYSTLGIGYLLQGANTALKGQGTPNGSEKNIVIIKTQKLNQMKILDVPGYPEYKILLVQPGVALKEAEVALNKINFSLPHKTGSHDLGNTFGASYANACGGVQVNNKDGRPSLTQAGELGVVSVNAQGLIYNGLLKPTVIHSGEELLRRIDNNDILFDEIEFPDLHEVDEFLKKLFIEKSYPIRNHRGERLFAGDGGEGSQVAIYLMYLIRKKPETVQTFGLLLESNELKEQFYKEVIFSEGPEQLDYLPVLCESMNAALTNELVNKGTCFLMATVLATQTAWLAQFTPKLMMLRNTLLHKARTPFIKIESWLGKQLARFLIPKALRAGGFADFLLIQVAKYHKEQNNILLFEKKLMHFQEKNPSAVQILPIKSNPFSQSLLLETRTAAAAATLTIALRENGLLYPFDDALMPGQMTTQYSTLLKERITEKIPCTVLGPYIYGHDLKQISHNEWVIVGTLSKEQQEEIYNIQFRTVREVGGFAHAEHGVGDHADTDLDDAELIKLIAHRLLNDIEGLANPGGGPEKAFQKACHRPELVTQAIVLANQALQNELIKKTLLTWEKSANPAQLQQQLTARCNQLIQDKRI